MVFFNMIHFTQGNLLDAPVEALINTVNEVGVMGKGSALMLREAFPKIREPMKQLARPSKWQWALCWWWRIQT